jgi:hypothetical protein
MTKLVWMQRASSWQGHLATAQCRQTTMVFQGMIVMYDGKLLALLKGTRTFVYDDVKYNLKIE